MKKFGCIVGIALILAVISSYGDSPIVDEVPHIGAGYSYLARLDDRLNPEHPPLAKDIAAVPLQFMHVNEAAFAGPAWVSEVNGQWNFGRQLIFNSGNNADAIKNWSRLAVLLAFFLPSCFLIWKWMREQYDERAALIAVTLFAFSPTVLAHARLVTTDMAAAAGVLFATYFFWKFLETPTRRTFWWATLMLGLAFLCKFNTVLLIPYFLCATVIANRRLFWQTALICITAFVAVVWPVYIIQTWNYPLERQHADTQHILSWHKDNSLKALTLWASDKPVIRALGQWTLGLTMVAQRSQGGNLIYWFGKVVTAGGPGYFPIVYFLKEPLAWWGLVLIALIFAFLKRKEGHPLGGKGAPRPSVWLWFLWLAIYWIVSIQSTLNIGVRHLLPIYPFAIMLVAGQVSRIRTRWLAPLVWILIGWYVFESVSVFPYYLTYFNQVALIHPSWAPAWQTGGVNYVADSNLDWGQDLRRLGHWVRDNNIAHVSLDYFGWSDPSYYLKDRYVYATATQFKDAKDFIAHNHSNGWLAVSATYLQNDIYGNGYYRWLLNDSPVTVVGHSIFVWHITK